MQVKNPYEVLGLDSNAGMDEVKRAYREKAKLYNEDFAKMDELNEAYDAIVMGFGNSRANSNYNYTNAGAGYSGTTSEFGDIRAKLNSGRIDDAEMLLDGIPHQRRNAEWYYIKGTIQHRRGWLESAAESFEKAHKMEPSNQEYYAAYRELNKEKKGAYRQERQQQTNSGCGDPCDICTGLCCADACCECMGGDLIRCC